MFQHLLTKSLLKNSEETALKKSRGFTIVELLVVVVILGILVAFAVPAYFRYISAAKLTLAHGALDTIRKTLEAYHIDYQQYPVTINFTTGKDDMGQTVFQETLLGQINKDLSSVDSYVSDTLTYTLTVKANNDEQTVMTLTPQEITY